MATVSDNLTLSNIAELTDLEEQIEALQSAKREFYTAVRDEHGKTYANGLKSAIKLSRMDSAKRATQDETDAETFRILALIESGLVARGAPARENIEQFDPETGEITESQDHDAASAALSVDGSRASLAGVEGDVDRRSITSSPPEHTPPGQNLVAEREGDNSSDIISTPDGGGDTTEPDSGLGEAEPPEVATQSTAARMDVHDLTTDETQGSSLPAVARNLEATDGSPVAPNQTAGTQAPPVDTIPDATDLTAKTAAGTQPAAAPLAFLPTPKPLRPHCQHPDDLSQCPGQGAKHCYACRKAAWLEGREAA